MCGNNLSAAIMEINGNSNKSHARLMLKALGLCSVLVPSVAAGPELEGVFTCLKSATWTIFETAREIGKTIGATTGICGGSLVVDAVLMVLLVELELLLEFWGAGELFAVCVCGVFGSLCCPGDTKSPIQLPKTLTKVTTTLESPEILLFTKLIMLVII